MPDNHRKDYKNLLSSVSEKLLSWPAKNQYQAEMY